MCPTNEQVYKNLLHCHLIPPHTHHLFAGSSVLGFPPSPPPSVMPSTVFTSKLCATYLCRNWYKMTPASSEILMKLAVGWQQDPGPVQFSPESAEFAYLKETNAPTPAFRIFRIFIHGAIKHFYHYRQCWMVLFTEQHTFPALISKALTSR